MRDSGDELNLEVLTYSAAVQRITDRVVTRLGEVDGPMKILEAGCGRRWEIQLEPGDFHLTGVDLDEHALEHRRSVTADLDIGVVGSISDRNVVPLGQYDLVYSAYVLEHVIGAQIALENFVAWAAPGGLIVMMLPNRDSVYGWAARHTPYRAHVWIYRYLFGNPDAGKPGFSPYPTYHDPVLGVKALNAFCQSRDLSIQEWFAIDTFAQREGAKYALVRSGMRFVRRLSLGRLSDCAVDLGIVLQVPLGSEL
jgi:SAM-dependent methyltransferase